MARSEGNRVDPEPAHPEQLIWAPPAYATQGPPNRLGIGSGVVIGLFSAVLMIAVAVVVSGAPKTIAGHPSAAPGVATAMKVEASPKPSAPGPDEVRRVRELATNPLLAEGVTLAGVTCALPALGRSDGELKAFYAAEIKCLDEAWNPALAKVKEPITPVAIQVKVPPQSACGQAPDSSKAMAYYCAGDLTIYAPSEWMLQSVGLYKGSHLATIAHEYGHHVQYESGILDAANAAMTTEEQTSPDDLERVRRIELQANCFGALFIAGAAGRGAITASTANAAIADYGNTSDSDTHGSRKHQLSWARAGFEGKTTAACNTWAAPAADVT
jgi:predicted metalloprotease